MNTKYSLTLISILIVCCSPKEKNSTPELVSFKSSFLRHSILAEHMEHSWPKEIIKIDTIQDTLDVKVDLQFGSCADFEGGITVLNDSLILQYWLLKDDTLCPALEHYELSYKIVGLPDKKYIVGLRYN